MLKFFGRLFGSEKALDTIISSTAKGLDALVYTGEERAADAAADRSEARKMVVAWMSSTQGQNLARRLIALSITAVWLSQFVISQVIQVAAVWADRTPTMIDGVTVLSTADKMAATATVLTEGAAAMNGAVMLILAFYFAAPHMGDIAKAVTQKFTRSVNKG